MPDAVQHAPHLRRVLDLDLVADPPKADRAQRVALRAVGAVRRLHLPDLHDDASPSAAPSPAVSAGVEASVASVASAGVSASALGALSASAPGPVPFAAACSLASAATGASAPPLRPSTALTDRPRSSATSSGLRRPCSPVIVALTRLIGFCEPS